jgi:hypothetical protein
MLSDLVDHAGLWFLLLGIAGLVLASLWWMTRRREYVWAFAGVAALIALLWLLTRFVVTDRMQIVRTVQVMAQAVQQRNLDEFFKHVASSFRHETMNAPELRRYMESQLKRHQVRTFHVTGVRAEDVARTGKSGKAEFWIQVEGDWEGGVPPMRCESTFTLERDEWRLQGFKLFLGNTGNEFRLPSGP